MKGILIILLIILSSYSAQADELLLGKWVDKSNSKENQFEFSKNSDFTHTYFHAPSNTTSVYKGVWEIGLWNITKGDRTTSQCSLTIYINDDECCFEYKFIGNNLILTNKYRSDEYSSVCNNRVLVRPNNK